MKNILIPTNDQFPSSADAVIIGGGIVGVASAFWMARAGLTTVLIEMRDALCTLTSANSFESLRSQFATPPLIEMTKESIAFYEHFAKFSKTPDYDIGFSKFY